MTFEQWWDTVANTPAPDTFKRWEESCRQAWAAAQAQAAAQCIGKDPLCPCQDGDTCHYEGKDAWPVPQDFPFMPWSKETEMMESWAQHGAVEPVGYFYFDDGVYKQAGDPISFPGCVKLYTSPPDHTKAMRLALEALQGVLKANRITQSRGLPDTYAEADRIRSQIISAVSVAEAAIAALEGALK